MTQLRRSCPTITPGFNRGTRDITHNNPGRVSQKQNIIYQWVTPKGVILQYIHIPPVSTGGQKVILMITLFPKKQNMIDRWATLTELTLKYSLPLRLETGGYLRKTPTELGPQYLLLPRLKPGVIHRQLLPELEMGPDPKFTPVFITFY